MAKHFSLTESCMDSLSVALFIREALGLRVVAAPFVPPSADLDARRAYVGTEPQLREEWTSWWRDLVTRCAARPASGGIAFDEVTPPRAGSLLAEAAGPLLPTATTWAEAERVRLGAQVAPQCQVLASAIGRGRATKHQIDELTVAWLPGVFGWQVRLGCFGLIGEDALASQVTHEHALVDLMRRAEGEEGLGLNAFRF